MFTKLLFGTKNEHPKELREKSKEIFKIIDNKISEIDILIQKFNTLQIILRENAKNKLIEHDKSEAKKLLYKRKKVLEKLKQIESAKSFVEE